MPCSLSSPKSDNLYNRISPPFVACVAGDAPCTDLAAPAGLLSPAPALTLPTTMPWIFTPCVVLPKPKALGKPDPDQIQWLAGWDPPLIGPFNVTANVFGAPAEPRRWISFNAGVGPNQFGSPPYSIQADFGPATLARRGPPL